MADRLCVKSCCIKLNSKRHEGGETTLQCVVVQVGMAILRWSVACRNGRSPILVILPATIGFNMTARITITLPLVWSEQLDTAICWLSQAGIGEKYLQGVWLTLEADIIISCCLC